MMPHDRACVLDPKAYDLEAGVNASLHHAAETAAQRDAPLMDALMRSLGCCLWRVP